MDWQENFADGHQLIDTVNARLAAEQERIRYVNMRYKQYGQAETPWLFNVTMRCQDECIIFEQAEDNRMMQIPLVTLEYLKMRPFYFAACVGFKEFVLYAYPASVEDQEN